MALHKKPAVALFMGCRDDSVRKQLASQAWRPELTLWHPQVRLGLAEGGIWLRNNLWPADMLTQTIHAHVFFPYHQAQLPGLVYFPASGLSDKENNCLVMSQLPYNYVAHCFNSNKYHVTGRHLRGDLAKLRVYYICSHASFRFSVNSSEGPLIGSEHR